MQVKIIVLRTGEKLICGIAELIDEEKQKGVCFVIKHPHVLSMIPTNEMDAEGNPRNYTVNFSKWIPYSSDVVFKIPYEAIVAIGEVEENILNTYLAKYGKDINQDDDDMEKSGIELPESLEEI
jgi:hypothetical protein